MIKILLFILIFLTNINESFSALNNEIKTFNQKLMNKNLIFNLVQPNYQNNLNEYIEEMKAHKLYARYSKNFDLNKIDLNNLQYGVIVDKTDLRFLPTTVPLMDDRFDLLELTEVKFGEGINIITYTKDKNWALVATNNYIGWLKTKSIAYTNSNTFKSYLNIYEGDFLVNTSPKTVIENKEINMGAKFELVKETSNLYHINFPTKNNKDILTFKKVKISKSSNLHYGFLNYNETNILKQADKYLGNRYLWGGMSDKVDCSGFINNVFATFGFILPRDSSKINLINNATTLDIKEAKVGDLIYFNGHIMLYIGDGKIIHSVASYYNKNKQKVNVMKVKTDYLDKIYRKNNKTFLENIENIITLK